MSDPSPLTVNVPEVSEAIPVSAGEPMSLPAHGDVKTPTVAEPEIVPLVAVTVARVPVAGAVYLPVVETEPAPEVTAQV